MCLFIYGLGLEHLRCAGALQRNARAALGAARALRGAGARAGGPPEVRGGAGAVPRPFRWVFSTNFQ